jgi:hypothetical protein
LPELSVVVTLVEGTGALERCLAALAAQHHPPDLEVLVPWDGTRPDVPALAGRYPSTRFIELGRLRTERPAASPAGHHELIDRRRAAGLGAATAQIVAIIEDRGAPDPDWARSIVDAHARLSNAVIGGAVESLAERSLEWAIYLCDFGRYQRPFTEGPRGYVSDVNVSYKRTALDRTASLWADQYHETTVHGALRQVGEVLMLTPAAIVRQTPARRSLKPVIGERVAWGRLFASTRAREIGPAARALLAIASPLLPAVLLARLVVLPWKRPETAGRFLRAVPYLVLLLAAWSAGEALGYVTARR